MSKKRKPKELDKACVWIGQERNNMVEVHVGNGYFEDKVLIAKFFIPFKSDKIELNDNIKKRLLHDYGFTFKYSTGLISKESPFGDAK